MSRPRIVIVGAGFAGYRTAKELSRKARGKADITLLNPTDYFLYLPLLPQVAAGLLEPRRVTVSLSGTLPHVRLVLGEADGIDMDAQTVHYTDPEGDEGTLAYDRLVLAVGSVNKLLPIPGVAEYAHGFRGLPEALYLRDHVTRQVELAAAADDRATCQARCTFVVVGAGYTGTEVAAHGQLYTDAQVRGHPLREDIRPRWILLDVADRVLPELDEHLSRTADHTLRERGVEVRMGTSVKEATPDGVLLTDGEFVETRTLVWCVGVRPDPLVESTGQPLERGRLVVDPYLQLPGRPEVFACGDAAAVPDLDNPGGFTAMTAQHAWRHGRTVAHNIAASFGDGEREAYRHRDLGFVVDLGGAKAAANPLGVPLSGVAAGAVTRGYHLAAMPGNRVRVAADWFLDAVLPRQAVQLGLVRSWSVPLESSSPELARVPGRPGARGEAEAGSGPGAAARADTETGPGRTPVEEEAGPEAGPTAVPGDPEAGQADPTEPAIIGVSAGEAVIAEAKARESAEAKTPDAAEGKAPERKAPGRKAPGRKSPERKAPERKTPEQKAPEPKTPERKASKRKAPERKSAVRKSAEAVKRRPAAEPAKNQPGGEPARNQPGPEPARNQPGAEPAKNQPGGEPGEAPGPVKRTDADPAEGDS